MTLHDPRFTALCEELARYPRTIGCGYYLVKLIAIEPVRDDDAIGRVIEQLDDQPWKPIAERPSAGAWSDYEITRQEARDEVTDGLIGGDRVGHTRVTISERGAFAIWDRFEAMFSPSARFFAKLGLGERDHVFSTGVVVIDEDRAGCLIVVESD